MIDPVIAEHLKATNEHDSIDTARRAVLRGGLIGGLVALGTLTSPMPVQAARLSMPDAGKFQIAFRNQHTGDTFNGTYRIGNKYLPDAFQQINYILRDFRRNEIFPIDPRVIDILYMTRAKAGMGNRPYEVLSGYRSPQTNSMLRRASTGVARNSLHLTGQAIDVRLPGLRTAALRDAAVSLHGGGVGYYPRSNFVHVDTGRVRSW